MKLKTWVEHTHLELHVYVCQSSVVHRLVCAVQDLCYVCTKDL